MREAALLSTPNAVSLWRRALQALSDAFDPAREFDNEDSVFQPGPARERAEPRPCDEAPPAPPRRAQDTLQ